MPPGGRRCCQMAKLIAEIQSGTGKQNGTSAENLKKLLIPQVGSWRLSDCGQIQQNKQSTPRCGPTHQRTRLRQIRKENAACWSVADLMIRRFNSRMVSKADPDKNEIQPTVSSLVYRQPPLGIWNGTGAEPKAMWWPNDSQDWRCRFQNEKRP